MVTTAGAFAAVGGALALWPLVDQMNPHPGTPPRETLLVDLSAIGVGRSKVVAWRGLPVIVRHRGSEEITAARQVAVEGLRDRQARNAMLPASASATDGNRTLPHAPRWLVVVGLCTHLGCVLRPDDAGTGANDGNRTMWICPCHAARFDSSGRVRSGPARTNLPVPPHRLLGTDRLEIGRA